MLVVLFVQLHYDLPRHLDLETQLFALGLRMVKEGRQSVEEALHGDKAGSMMRLIDANRRIMLGSAPWMTVTGTPVLRS